MGTSADGKATELNVNFASSDVKRLIFIVQKLKNKTVAIETVYLQWQTSNERNPITMSSIPPSVAINR